MDLRAEQDPRRLAEIAALLAKVFLRRYRPDMKCSAPQNVADSGSDCLAKAADSSLTVHTS